MIVKSASARKMFKIMMLIEANPPNNPPFFDRHFTPQNFNGNAVFFYILGISKKGGFLINAFFPSFPR